jgi:hypothetical protein
MSSIYCRWPTRAKTRTDLSSLCESLTHCCYISNLNLIIITIFLVRLVTDTDSVEYV